MCIRDSSTGDRVEARVYLGGADLGGYGAGCGGDIVADSDADDLWDGEGGVSVDRESGYVGSCAGDAEVSVVPKRCGGQWCYRVHLSVVGRGPG